jgi:hypothetical protein
MTDEQVVNSSSSQGPVTQDTTTKATASQHKIDFPQKMSKRKAKIAKNVEENLIKDQKNEKILLYNRKGWSIADYGQITTNRDQKIVECLKSIARDVPGFKVATFQSASCGGNFDFFNDRVLTLSKRQLYESFGALFAGVEGSTNGTIIVRQILDEIDEMTGLPWKNIYSFRFDADEVHRSPPHVTRGMCCRDFSGGMKTPEPSVNYC